MTAIQNTEKRKNRNKEEIIDAAEKFFFEKGYENSNMEEIAKEANYTKRTLYSYFKSKEEIYISIAERGYKLLSSMFKETIDKNKEETSLTKIKALGYTFISFYQDYTGYYTAAFEFKNTAVLSQEIEQSSLELLQKIIIEGINDEEIIEEDAITISLLLWSSIIGFIDTLIKKRLYIKDYIMKDSNDLIEKGFSLLLNSIKRSE